MTDDEILRAIHRLVEEEHELERRQERDGTSPMLQDRLQQLTVALDQCWDLLRQRRARISAGLDPDDAQVRSADTVERYQQ